MGRRKGAKERAEKWNFRQRAQGAWRCGGRKGKMHNIVSGALREHSRSTKPWMEDRVRVQSR